MTFDSDTRAGLAYALELAMDNVAGMYGLSSSEAKMDPNLAMGNMAFGSFLLLGILSALLAFLLVEDDSRSEYLMGRTIETLDPVMREVVGVPRHLAEAEGGELN